MKISLVENEEVTIHDLLLFVQEDYSVQLGLVGIALCALGAMYVIYACPKNKLL